MGEDTQNSKLLTSKLQRVFAAGGVVFKKEEGKVFWLVTKSTPSLTTKKLVWRLPKGWIDDGLSGLVPGPKALGKIRSSEEEIKEAALREVREEGGIDAKIIEKIGTEKVWRSFQGNRELKFITFYLMEWERNLPEGPGFETSEVQWLSYLNARKTLSYPDEKRVLDKAKVVLVQTQSSNLI